MKHVPQNILRRLDKNKLYYFASPYSHENTFIKQVRYEAAIYVASELTRRGFTLLEPIAMCHEQSTRHGMPSGYEFWQSRDRGFIDRCDAVLVFMLPGWKDSVGVSDEIAYAQEQEKEVYYLEPSEIISEDVKNAIY